MSGSTNVGDAFDLVVTRSAADSTYAGIVRLVEQAERARAPMARLADRFAIVFLAVTVVDRRRGVDPQRRPDPRRRGAGRGNALSLDPRRPGGARRRAVAGGAGSAS